MLMKQTNTKIMALQEYFEYIKNVRSIFCDFDGVLVRNSSKFSSPPWQYKPNIDNLKSLSDYLRKSPFSKIIITTSRPNNQKQNIINFEVMKLNV